LCLNYSQPSIFSYLYSVVELVDRFARELDASAKGRLDWAVGRGWGGSRKKERLRHLWKKSEFPVSPEMENSHWLKGDKKCHHLDNGCS